MSRRLAATVAALVLCPLGVGACGGTNVAVTTPRHTPEITPPSEASASEGSAKSSGSTKQSNKTSETGSTTETVEEPPVETETGGVEPTEEAATGGEEAPVETEEEAATEAEAEEAGGASAP